MSSRRLPLHTCGVSIIKIAMKASAAAQDLNGPLGSMARRVAQMTSPATPFVHALLYLWLVILSIADDHILAVEDIIAITFPPSKHVFNKIDELIQVLEKLPEKFDYAVKRFPTMIHQVPFLDWALVHFISLLELLVSVLAYWESEGAREKEIAVDMNCEDHDHDRDGESESALVTQAENEPIPVIEADNKPTKSPVHVESEDSEGDLPPVSETPQTETDTARVDFVQDCTKSNYKEVLEIKGKNDMRADQNVNDQEKTKEGKKKIAEEKKERPKDDLIIELLESGWLMKRGRRGK